MAWAAGETKELLELVDGIRKRVEKALAEGKRLPWQRPWVGEALNFVTGDSYSLLNTLWLKMKAEEEGYESPYWAGFKQMQDHKIDRKKYGGPKAGMHGVKLLAPITILIEDEDGNKKRVPTGRFRETAPVFNFDQCMNIKIPEKVQVAHDNKVYPSFEDVLNNWQNGPHIQMGGSRASYNPRTDTIHMPEREQFFSGLKFIGTEAHECIHATGHETRLKREGIVLPVSPLTERYAVEELIAESGAAMLLGACGIEEAVVDEDDQNVAYLLAWFRRSGATDLYNAFVAGAEAADYIMSGGKKKKELHPKEEHA